MKTGKTLWHAEKDKWGNLVWKEFPPLDPKEAIRKLDPKGRAHQFAASNSIEQIANEDALTSHELEMLEDVNHHLLNLQTWHNHATEDMISDVNEATAAIALHEQFDAITARFLANIRQLANEFRHDHENLLRKRLTARKDLAIFKDKNGIDRQSADYPDSMLFHFALVLAGLVFEGLVNSSFFPQSFGLLGGFITAVGVSFGNVALSFIIGALCLRNLNHTKISRKLLGSIGTLIGLLGITALHLFTAHYREAVTRSPDEQILNIIPHVWSSPLDINDMESIVLIIIGTTISVLAIYKGYTWDDRYPGFGPVYRKWKAYEDEVNEHMKQTKHSAMEMFNHAECQALNVPALLRSQETKLLKIKGQVDAYFSCFTTYHDRALQTAQSLIVAFRKTLHAVLENQSRFPYREDTIGSALRSIDPRDQRSTVDSLIRQRLSTIQTSLENYSKEKKVLIKELERDLSERVSFVDQLQEQVKDKESEWLAHGAKIIDGKPA